MSDKTNAAIELLQSCLDDVDGCEINMSNYGTDEVASINNAYIQMFGAIEQALTLLAETDGEKS